MFVICSAPSNWQQLVERVAECDNCFRDGHGSACQGLGVALKLCCQLLYRGRCQLQQVPQQLLFRLEQLLELLRLVAEVCVQVFGCSLYFWRLLGEVGNICGQALLLRCQLLEGLQHALCAGRGRHCVSVLRALSTTQRCFCSPRSCC